MSGLRAFFLRLLDLLFPPTPAEIAEEREALIKKLAEARALYRPISEMDARLRQLTILQLRQNRKRLWGAQA